MERKTYEPVPCIKNMPNKFALQQTDPSFLFDIRLQIFSYLQRE